MQGKTRCKFISIVGKNLNEKYCKNCSESSGSSKCTSCKKTKLFKKIIERANKSSLYDDPLVTFNEEEENILEIKTEIKEEFDDLEARIKFWQEYYADCNFFPVEDIVLDKEIDEKGFLGRTPLHVAVLENDLDEVKNLIKRGANTEALDNSDMTPYELAIVEEKTEIVEFFESLE